MTIQNIIGTLAGAFIFPFIIRLAWGKMLSCWGPIGGWMAAGFIVGTCWSLNHGVGFIFQSGTAWIDMAWAAGFGLFTASLVSGDKLGEGATTAIMAILGGTLGGFILSCVI